MEAVNSDNEDETEEKEVEEMIKSLKLQQQKRMPNKRRLNVDRETYTEATPQLFRTKKLRKAKIYNETIQRMRSDNEDETEEKKTEKMVKSLKLQHVNVQ